MPPHVLIILDGWGVSKEERGNAIRKADTPNMDRLAADYPSSLLQASGPAVGLPPNEDGNSEVGHLNLGSGRIVYQELSRISIQIADGMFFKNDAFLEACKHAETYNSNLCLMGLVGSGTVHSSLDHLFALLKLAAKYKLAKNQVHLHLFTDGRDSETNEALATINKIQEKINEYNVGVICSISGRYFAMDRNKAWDRTELAYKVMTEGIGEHAANPESAIKRSYNAKITDEFIKPTSITGKDGLPLGTISDNDALIFFNFRADRARQITKAFVLDNFDAFGRSRKLDNLYFVSMTEYEKGLGVDAVAYPQDDITKSLAEVLSKHNLKQFHIAETEKYAHLTYFFNGRREKPFVGEDRLLIPSPKVPTYDLKPEMSAGLITDTVLQKLDQDTYSFIVLNFANADMVAHTGNFKATVQAIEYLDMCIGKIVGKVLEKIGTVYITADHGNAEYLINDGIFRHEIATKHTTNPVPFTVVSEESQNMARTLENGVLGDVAPTILFMMDVPQPMEMTGRVLFI